MNAPPERYRPLGVLAATAIATVALIFAVSGIFDLRVDGFTYAEQIASFAAGRTSWSNHLDYRLLYPVVGGSILHTTHPYAFILAMNLLFYAVLTVGSYRLLRAMSFAEHAAMVGTVWIVSAYPVLKYGLALGTDISGWALSALTLYAGVVALNRDSIWLLLVASILGAIGGTARETGVAGLLAVFLLVLWRDRSRGLRVVLARTAAVTLPAVILYEIFVASRVSHGSMVVDWLGWIQANRVAAAGTQRESWATLVAVEASSFGLYWLGVAWTAARAVRRRHLERLDVILAAYVATSPALIWPFYVSRVLFIQFLWVIPLALTAYAHLRQRYESAPPGRRRAIVGLAAGAPVAANVALFLVSGGRSLFDVLGRWW